VSYILLKILHILSVTLFFGTGLGSVFYKLMADRTQDPRLIAITMKNVNLADTLFTIPSSLLLPLTGLGMCQLGGIPLKTDWVSWGIALYLIAGLCWLPAWRLQYRMQRLAEQALAQNTTLDPAYWQATRIWAGLGIPSFFAVIGALALMVGKWGFLH
jgi:uncharacterized membrane protein